MKNGFLFFVLFSLTLTGIIADDFGIKITDYFPSTVGDSWAYANDSGRIIDRRNVVYRTEDKIANDGTPVYIIEYDVADKDIVAYSFSIKDNQVVLVSQKGIRGDERFYSQPYPVELAPPFEQWTFFDYSAGLEYFYKTYKGVCMVGKNNYNDCIIVEQSIPVIDKKKTTYRVTKSYYARDIGLVLVTEQSGKKEIVIKRLANITLSIARLWEFEQVSNGLVITNYKGNSLPGSIPDFINGTRVVGVETAKPLENGVRIGIIDHLIKPEEVVIPSTVLYIGDFAFYRGSLRRVAIPYSVRSIGRFAYAMNPEIRNIDIPANVELKENSFEYGFVGLYNHLGKKAGSYIVSFVDNDQWSYAIWSYENIDYLIILKYKGTAAVPRIPADFNQTRVFAVLRSSGLVPPADSDVLVW
jgi:hypothetical protein